jgi:iron(II)-dependent oxidoreductase
VSNRKLLDELALSQLLILTLIEQNRELYNLQTDPELSPLGWHLGHCVFIECYWIQEILYNNSQITAPLADLYTPPRTPKTERGEQLPACKALLDWARQLQETNLQTLQDLPAGIAAHKLFNNDYLLHFLIQHYCQHYETMLMILTRKALTETKTEYQSTSPLQSTKIAINRIPLPAGHYRIGGQEPVAYDNELPPQQADLGPFEINRTPVSNAEFLGFMEDGGYNRPDLWNEHSLPWQQHNKFTCPDHWQQDEQDNWFAMGVRGPYELAAEEPVMGLSHYEACAFANWAGARLPHEYQWETACRLQGLQLTGRVWEWCQNTFHPYQGFKPFPYDEYSQPWFDGEHFSLRGGSLYSRPAIKRPSFRNFYQADKRFIFAGLRLAW